MSTLAHNRLKEIERAAQNVVARRHARQGAGVVAVESHRAGGEPVEIGRLELGSAVRAQHVPVKAVEQDDDDISRGWHGGGLVHNPFLARSAARRRYLHFG